MKKNIIIIGGGPGGYVAGIRAAQLGANVTLVEEKDLGGTCLNRGCIPTKVFLHTADLFNQVKKGASIGLMAENVSIDWSILQKRKFEVVNGLVAGIETILRKNNVTILNGSARFINEKKIEITHPDGSKEQLDADFFIIATGSKPVLPSISGFDMPGILTSNEALELHTLPKSVLLVGGGVVGVEFAYLFSNLGVKVSVIEMAPEILPNIDVEMATMLKRHLAAMGISFFTSASVTFLKKTKDGFSADVEETSSSKKMTIEAEKVLVCAGRCPNTSYLKLDAASVKLDRGRVIVNERMETTTNGIFAVGDCASKIMLAHVASKEGEIAAENIMGGNVAMSYDIVPNCIFTKPELASVGMNEKQAMQKGYELMVGRFPLSGNGKSQITNESDGFIKVIADKKYGEVLGVHILGPSATELIAEGTLAIDSEIVVDNIIKTIHAHPTISEAMKEAALAVYGRAIHLPPKNS